MSAEGADLARHLCLLRGFAARCGGFATHTPTRSVQWAWVASASIQVTGDPERVGPRREVSR